METSDKRPLCYVVAGSNVYYPSHGSADWYGVAFERARAVTLAGKLEDERVSITTIYDDGTWESENIR